MTIERIGVAEAKRRFSELADRVGRGESFVIMSRGRPVIALVPPQRAAEEEPQPSVGLAAFAGALADEWDTVDEDMAEIVAARQRVSDRPAPEFT
ncbi:MAG: type II toxin-antitoxin system prevent-host-death family antitoxin [Pseudonocardiaceae bacterium]|jgi:prevent-host-death family protein|nr:type II toxin-antitoxin system prevent-host-death family antitoxin [Pseudonocardiaceae bacterium]